MFTSKLVSAKLSSLQVLVSLPKGKLSNEQNDSEYSLVDLVSQASRFSFTWPARLWLALCFNVLGDLSASWKKLMEKLRKQVSPNPMVHWHLVPHPTPTHSQKASNPTPHPLRAPSLSPRDSPTTRSHHPTGLEQVTANEANCSIQNPMAWAAMHCTPLNNVPGPYSPGPLGPPPQLQCL